jgi:hypothetical protein
MPYSVYIGGNSGSLTDYGLILKGSGRFFHFPVSSVSACPVWEVGATTTPKAEEFLKLCSHLGGHIVYPGLQSCCSRHVDPE